MKKSESSKKEFTTITVEKEIKEQLSNFGNMNQKWDLLFKEIIDFIKKREKEWKTRKQTQMNPTGLKTKKFLSRK